MIIIKTMKIGNNIKSKDTINISGSRNSKSENLKVILLIRIIVRALITGRMIASMKEVVIEIFITIVKMIYNATSKKKKKALTESRNRSGRNA